MDKEPSQKVRETFERLQNEKRKHEMESIKQRLADLSIERFELWERYKELNLKVK